MRRAPAEEYAKCRLFLDGLNIEDPVELRRRVVRLHGDHLERLERAEEAGRRSSLTKLTLDHEWACTGYLEQQPA
jgi:hypothetical protein